MASNSSASGRPDIELSPLATSIGGVDETAAEQNLARVVGDILQRMYPAPKEIGFWWAVTANAKGGVLHILNLALSGTHGYTLYMDGLMGGEGPKRIMRAGGELLERAGLSRDWRNLSPDKVAELQRNVRGNIQYLM